MRPALVGLLVVLLSVPGGLIANAQADPLRPTASLASATATPKAHGFSVPGDHRLPKGTVTVTYDVTGAARTPLATVLAHAHRRLAKATGVAVYLAGGTRLSNTDLTTVQRLGAPRAQGGQDLPKLTRLLIYNLRTLQGGIECTEDSGLACAGQRSYGGWAPFIWDNGWRGSWVRELTLDDLQKIRPGSFSDTTFSRVSFRSVRYVARMAFGQGPRSPLADLYLPNARHIGADAFRRNQNLLTVRLPKVRTIDPFAFDDASRLLSFDAPLLKTIGRNALNDSHALRTVHMPRVEYIGINCFDLNDGVTTLSFPKLKYADNNALVGFARLRVLRAPELTGADGQAFAFNAKLTTFIAPKLVNYPDDVFQGDTRLKHPVTGR